MTYTVSVETTAYEWETITLTDELPAGFTLDPASVQCSVVPVEYESDDCFTVSGNKITVEARAIDDRETYQFISSPAVITLQFSGTVAGDPGAIIENEACSIRTLWQVRPLSVGDPTIPGGGEICESAAVQIEMPATTATPTPSPTATGTEDPNPTATTIPGTPDASSGATSRADSDSTTSSVTGLPETGQGAGAFSSMFMMLVAAVSMLMLAVGLRLRSQQR